MKQRGWFILAGLAAVVAVIAVNLWLWSRPRPVSAATSPDGTWSVVVVGEPRLNGAYELVLTVRDSSGHPAGGGFVIGLTRDLSKAEQFYAVRFLDDHTAQVGDRTLEKSRYLQE